MTAARVRSIINSWETVRYELLNTRISDLGLAVKGSPVEQFVERLEREFERKGFVFRPTFYLTDNWGCPDEVPIIGIPFYLADRRLIRIEEEQTGQVEDAATIMMFMRHEGGHAVNYAYRLWEDEEWVETFGRFSAPYRESFRPDPFSRDFVRHLAHGPYRRPTYAQKHPDEDFAETFAVWLTPRSGWQRRYGNWPAARKLRYVARLMRRIRAEPPKRVDGKLYSPVESMTVTLAEHYGQRAERYRAAAQGYVDDKLREAFGAGGGRTTLTAGAFVRKHRRSLVARVARWSGMSEEDAGMIVAKVEARATALRLRVKASDADDLLLDLTALVTGLAVGFDYSGRFTE
jgi:hypothetical protein